MNKKELMIIKTTIELFIREGIKKTTMDDIAIHSKSSKVTIYKYFTNKESLLFEISKYIYDDYIEQMKSVNRSNDTLVEKLYKFLDVIIDFTNSKKLKLCNDLKEYNYDIEQIYNQYLIVYTDTILAMIKEGKKCGSIRADLKSDIIFHYIDMGLVYYQTNQRYKNKMLGDSNFQEKFIRFFICNIFNDSDKLLSLK